MQANSTAIERHLVTVGGTQVEYLVAGQGPDVVLLHGLGESGEDWRGVMTHLSPSYRVYAPTWPGLGDDRRAVQSSGNAQDPGAAHGAVENPSAEALGRFCNAFIDEKDLQRPVLGGQSLGGLIALRAALDRPDRVRALILIAAAGLGRGVTPVLRATALPVVGDIGVVIARSRPGAMLRAVSKAPMVFGRPWRIPQPWLADQYRRARDGRFIEITLRSLRMQVGVGGQRQVVLDELSALTLPTLVLWGTADRVVPVAHGRAAAALLPAGQLQVLDGLGHVPHVEDPGRVASALRGFLDGLA